MTAEKTTAARHTTNNGMERRGPSIVIDQIGKMANVKSRAVLVADNPQFDRERGDQDAGKDEHGRVETSGDLQHGQPSDTSDEDPAVDRQIKPRSIPEEHIFQVHQDDEDHDNGKNRFHAPLTVVVLRQMTEAYVARKHVPASLPLMSTVASTPIDIGSVKQLLRIPFSP